MKILFMGTPDFAVKPFLALCEAFEVVGAVTQPDKPKGRHMTLTPPAVKTAALEKGIPVFQPTSLKDNSLLPLLQELSPDLVAVVAYGKILPPYLLQFPRLGCVNLHGSLLPKYRGAAPMQRAIMEGEEKTGVTTMYMAEGLDTGDMLEKAEISITEEDNFESVHDKLSALGASLLVSTIRKLEAKEIFPEEQDDRLATYAAKIENKDCVIDFQKNAHTIFNQVRGLSPYPLAVCRLRDKTLKIIDCRVLPPERQSTLFSSEEDRLSARKAPAGTVLSLADGVIIVKCGEGMLAIRALLPEGKSRMKAADFINGRKIAPGDLLQ